MWPQIIFYKSVEVKIRKKKTHLNVKIMYSEIKQLVVIFIFFTKIKDVLVFTFRNQFGLYYLFLLINCSPLPLLMVQCQNSVTHR